MTTNVATSSLGDDLGAIVASVTTALSTASIRETSLGRAREHPRDARARARARARVRQRFPLDRSKPRAPASRAMVREGAPARAHRLGQRWTHERDVVASRAITRRFL